MAEILHTLSIISFVLAVLFVVIAIIFWFVFKIPNVIGDLSGHNARKSIAQMRQKYLERVIRSEDLSHR